MEIISAPLTLQNASSLIRNEVDQRIVKLRPMSTPLDQISRHAQTRPTASMTVEYFTVNMRQFSTTVEVGRTATAISSVSDVITIRVADPNALEVSETLLIEGVNTPAGRPMLFYVCGIDRSKREVTLRPLLADPKSGTVPAIISGSKVQRMGRAAGELDVQTGTYAVTPDKKENNCQIFKAQVEQSVLASKSNKEVGWTFSDQEEVAIYDMRLGMERSFLFGDYGKLLDPVRNVEIHLTGGIWYQAGNEVNYSTAEPLNWVNWSRMLRSIFTGHDSSSRKVLFAGSGLIERIQTMKDENRLLTANERKTLWGLDFSEIVSKFGTLYVIHSEVLDSAGHANDGLVIDPEFLTKYVHTPFKADTLDLRTSGQRNTQAVVLTEIACLVLRHPQAHCRIVAKS